MLDGIPWFHHMPGNCNMMAQDCKSPEAEASFLGPLDKEPLDKAQVF